MDKGGDSSLFVNDGSFMEKFKQMQEEKNQTVISEEPKSNISKPVALVTKPLSIKMNDTKKSNSLSSSGKLAFSLKQKSKIAVPVVKLGAEEDDDEVGAENASVEGPSKRLKHGQADASSPLSYHIHRDVVSAQPSKPEVRKVADKLASFVAKHGRQFENVTRQKNPGDTPFKFLFDTNCADYKYYEQRLLEEERILTHMKESTSSSGGGGVSTSATTMMGTQRNSVLQHSYYQTPASALYGTSEGEANTTVSADPIAMMEFYMKKAAHEERRRQPRQSKDEMPPPTSFEAPVKRGHHMGDYIPQEELEKFMSTCNDVAAQKAAKEAAEKAKIQADNVGHKLLSKMGWKEGEGLGSSKSGRADPVMAGNVKLNNLGVGAEQPGEVTPDDDIYEQYKKRMMLGYRYRPNPLNNPRKAYY